MRIQDTLNSYGGNFARPTKFEIIISPPLALQDQFGQAVDTLCKTVTVPEITMTPIEMSFKGHKVNIPGRVNQEQTINITFNIDEMYKIQKLFHDWIGMIDDRYYAPGVYNKDAFGSVIIIARDYYEQNEARAWMFQDVIPLSVAGPEFSGADKDTVSEFGISLSYYRFLTGNENDDQDTFLSQFGQSAQGNQADGFHGGMNIGDSFSNLNFADSMAGLAGISGLVRDAGNFIKGIL